MPTDFKNCYETLGLTPEADWRKVQSTYRQLLIRWHPDRHRENNVSEDDAKQHFISLSTSFNALRDFQREHKRLPLQSAVDSNLSEPPISQSGEYRQVNAAAIKRKRQQAEIQKERLRKHQQNAPTFDLSDEQLMDASLVKASARPSFKEQLKQIRSRRRVMTGLTILLVFLLALLLFFVLDSTNSAWRHNEAKRIVIEKGPSEFDMPAEDILRGRSSK